MVYCTTRWTFNWLLLVAGICLVGTSFVLRVPVPKKYQIEDGSKLCLKGTSNVNAFACDCNDQYSQRTLEAETSGGYTRFRNADLFLKSKNFDCHNRKIDGDMQKALQSDKFPLIKVSLTDTWQNAQCLSGGCKDWFEVKANVKIKLTDVTKDEFITAKAKVLGPNKFQLQGEKALQMSAYGIKPPEAMLGMIKVNDWISFQFDLVVSVSEAQ
jgi:hypothetical protein